MRPSTELLRSHETHKPNVLALLALLIGIAVIPVSVMAAVSHHRNAKADQQRWLSQEAGKQTEILRNYFARARTLTQITARNPVFGDFYRLPGSRKSKLRGGNPSLREANQALSFLHKLFPDSIGEACFIDRSGPENARTVGGSVAPIAKLSPDESKNPFFGPTFALHPGEVYQAPPYVSPDTHDWVISNSTPIGQIDGRKQAIVHFEVTVESFRRNAALSSDRADIAIVDAHTGRVIFDSRHPQVSGRQAPLGRPSDRRFVSLVKNPAVQATVEADGRNAAYERVGRMGQNANDWIVFAVAQSPVGSWLDSFGAGEIGLLAAGLLLLMFAGTSLRSSQRELTHAALTDPLTGLPNRRKLMIDLEEGISQATPEQGLVMMLFDLDGFKAYNDNFGHPAGDTLLARLGHSLAAVVEPEGSAYRMGGDEFCVLARISGDERMAIAERATVALSEHGEGFTVTASSGSVLVPAETRHASEALRLADQRMYMRKAAGRSSAGRETTDVLLKVLSERSPELGEHLDEVADLAQEVGRRLELSDDDMTALIQAATLHDVGKAAIPDAILNKAGPLDEDEWQFIRRHTLIGERILAAAPSLVHAAKLVRWSHERYDGRGYTDRLAGDDIPLGSRIIAVCDAYDAMTSDRPYRKAMSMEGALSELRQCAGAQFDPKVVEVFCQAIRERAHGAAVHLG